MTPSPLALEGGLFLARRHLPQLDRLVPLPEASVLPSGLHATLERFS